MTPAETKLLLDLAKTWQSAADLHNKAMNRNRGFAKPGKENYDFYLAKAAHEEIKAELCESHARILLELVNQLSSSANTKVEPQSDSISIGGFRTHP